MRNIITFMLEEIKFRMRNIDIFLKEIEFRNVEMLLYFLKNQLLTKIDFQMFVIEILIVK
jgi:putative ribosome biogenesis GTPase RsgA